VLGQQRGDPYEFRAYGAGGTGIEPAPCGCGVCLVSSTGVRTRPPHRSFTGFHGTQCRLVSTCVVVGCCQNCCQLRCAFDASQARWAPAHSGPTPDLQRQLLRPAQRVSVAVAAASVWSIAHSVRLLSPPAPRQSAQRRDVAQRSHPAAPPLIPRTASDEIMK
jgi:hypothetical protein